MDQSSIKFSTSLLNSSAYLRWRLCLPSGIRCNLDEGHTKRITCYISSFEVLVLLLFLNVYVCSISLWSLDVFEKVLWVEVGHHGVFLSMNDEGGAADQGQKFHADTPWQEDSKVTILTLLSLQQNEIRKHLQCVLHVFLVQNSSGDLDAKFIFPAWFSVYLCPESASSWFQYLRVFLHTVRSHPPRPSRFSRRLLLRTPPPWAASSSHSTWRRHGPLRVSNRHPSTHEDAQYTQFTQYGTTLAVKDNER